MIFLVSFYVTIVVLKHYFCIKEGWTRTNKIIMGWGKEIEMKVKTIDTISYHLILELQRSNNYSKEWLYKPHLIA